MPKKHSIDIQVAKKKDLTLVLDSIQAKRKKSGTKRSYSEVQQAVYNLLKKDNPLGLIWLIFSEKNCIGYAILTYGYSVEFGGKEATLDEFFIEPEFQQASTELQALEQIKTAAKELAISALHLDYNAKTQDLSQVAEKASFKARENFRRLTVAL